MCGSLLLVYEILLDGIALHVAVYLVHLWDEGHSGTCYIIILSGLQARLLLSKIPMGKFLSKNSNSLINIRFICIIFIRFIPIVMSIGSVMTFFL